MRSKYANGMVIISVWITLGFILLPMIGVMLSPYNQGINPSLWGTVVEALRVSLKASTLGMLFVVGFGGLSAYWIKYYAKESRRWIEYVLDIPLILPPAVIGLVFLITWGKQGIVGKWLYHLGIQIPFSTGAVVMIMIFIGLPLFIKGVLESLERVEYVVEESARLEGCNEWQLCRYIRVPIAQSGIMQAVWLTWVRMLSEFGATMMFAGNVRGITQTLPLAIYASMDNSIEQALAIALTMIVLIGGVRLVVGLMSKGVEKWWKV